MCETQGSSETKERIGQKNPTGFRYLREKGDPMAYGYLRDLVLSDHWGKVGKGDA